MTNTLADVEYFDSAPCSGFAEAFGAGSPGTGGTIPALHARRCPRIGTMIELQLRSGVSQGVGLVLFSVFSSPFPIFGGTGYVLPPFMHSVPFALGATGSADVEQPLPGDPALTGFPIYLQAGVLDGAAFDGIALTNAVALTLGS